LAVHGELGHPHPTLPGELGDRRPLRPDLRVLTGIGDEHQSQRGEAAGLLGLLVLQVPAGQATDIGHVIRARQRRARVFAARLSTALLLVTGLLVTGLLVTGLLVTGLLVTGLLVTGLL